ncbi:hypothetical protein D3C80_1390750 [compost metagenome]
MDHAMSGLSTGRGGEVQQTHHLAAGLGHAPVGGEVGGGAAEGFLPEATAVEEVRDRVLYRPAQFTRQPRDRGHPLRQDGFYARAQVAGKNGR